MNTNLSSGQVVAGYRIESFIARGGMAAVYRAKDLSLGRDVALKLLDPTVAESETFRQRFVRESQLAAALDHPNIIPIYDADAVNGLLYIAMRYVPGSTLQALFAQSGPMAVDRALGLLGQIASALDAAHAHGLVHRDVKPHNVLVTAATERGGGEHAYLTDFGLTKRAASLSGLTAVGNFLGTIDYISPEQVTGDPVSSQTDVYALGCVLFQALTGQVPFVRDHDAAVICAPQRLTALGLRAAPVLTCRDRRRPRSGARQATGRPPRFLQGSHPGDGSRHSRVAWQRHAAGQAGGANPTDCSTGGRA